MNTLTIIVYFILTIKSVIGDFCFTQTLNCSSLNKQPDLEVLRISCIYFFNIMVVFHKTNIETIISRWLEP